MSSTWKPERWLLAAGVACLALVVMRNLGVMSPLLPGVYDKAYNGVEFIAVALCGLRAWRSTKGERAAWAMLTLGMAGFAAGDVYYTVALKNLDEPPFPSLADAGYLSIYPAAYAGLVLLVRARAPRMSSALWLDGLVCGLACAAVGAALVFGVVASTEGSFAIVATNLAYPLGDLMMLAFVVAVMVVTGRAGSTWLLLALAFAVFAIGDVIYLYQVALGTYEDFTLLDSFWPAAFLLVGFAAWRPVTRLSERRLRGGMLALPATFTLVALAMLVVDHYERLNLAAIWLATAAIATAVVRFAITFRDNLRTLGDSETEAATDALTGLGNRRALLRDLERVVNDRHPERPSVLALFDLDGFKSYNDSFGHPAGDALLARLGANFAVAVGDAGSAYRMGGDEFCVLATGAEGEDFGALIVRASGALRASGERFSIRSSHGAVSLSGDEACDPVEALRIADQRMYANKRGGRRSSDETVHRVLLRVAAEHDDALRDHVDVVADMVEAVARTLGLADGELVDVCRAAALHDIGKVAIPDAILNAPRALDAGEWEYMRQHTLIGERIIGAAPELLGVARIVRSSHERYDGKGYPDGLAGHEIPLGARIVAVCDAYDAIITTRSYRTARPPAEALAELQRCAGSQFDPIVVAAFAVVISTQAEPASVLAA